MPNAERLREGLIRRVKEFPDNAIVFGPALAVLAAAFKDWELASVGVAIFGIGAVIEAGKGLVRRVRHGKIEDTDKVAGLAKYESNNITDFTEHAGKRNSRKNVL